ncbi:hypothetical protein ACFWAP_26365 [Streptomyces goshikiensis]|uniref:hypothetical protein n=1 Tax=Streptomyces goshikiensis TaxID=1942 RepID=UPI0036499327
MGTAIVRRPTEAAALGRLEKSPCRTPSIGQAFNGLAVAERTGDLYGALLCRKLVQRIARDGRVGE